MAKGLCPGVSWSCGKESIEKKGRERKREREDNIFRVTWKTNKALTQDLYLSRRHRASSRGRESELGRVAHPEELAVENKKEPQPPRFRHQKYKVRELEKARFRKRMRLALYRNRLPLMRQEGAAVRLVS